MMSRRRVLLVLFLVLSLTISSCRSQPPPNQDSVDEDDLVQKNPDFVETAAKNETKKSSSVEEAKKKDAKEQDETDEEVEVVVEVDEEPEEVELEEDEEYEDEWYDAEEEEYDEEEAAIKLALAKALSESRRLPRVTLNFVKKNRVKLTLAAALYAFRKEIKQLALHIFTTPKAVDPKTGKVVKRSLNIHPTAVLKVILFLDVMRKFNSGDVTSSPQASSLLSKILHPSTTAYIPPIEQHWTFERVNERYTKDELALQKALSTETSIKSFRPSIPGFPRASDSGGQKLASTSQDTIILLDWTKLSESLPQLNSLRDQVSFLLSSHRAKNNTTTNNAGANSTLPTTEIVVILESPGGAAADYGLASQMILRLCHEPGMVVTVCVDKVAASGGYMIACASSPGRLFAAPFAVLGSIGVIGSTVNINSMLEGWGVKPLVFRGGKDKAPVGLIGEVTKEGIDKVQSMVDATHVAFKRHVVAARPVLTDKIDELATGKVWLGYEALEAGLIDRIITSDEYIGERIIDGARILRLVKHHKRGFLIPSPPSRINVSYAAGCFLASVKAMIQDFTQVFRAQISPNTVSGVQVTAPEYGLAAGVASLGVSPQQSGSKM